MTSPKSVCVRAATVQSLYCLTPPIDKTAKIVTSFHQFLSGAHGHGPLFLPVVAGGGLACVACVIGEGEGEREKVRVERGEGYPG